MIDFVELHKKLWLELARTKADFALKQVIVRQICKDNNVSRPTNNCFLCEDTVNDYGARCSLCKGNWAPWQRCDEGGLYTQWYDEEDHERRAELAYRIATICDEQQPMPPLG